MGQSTDAILAYGVDFGEEIPDWLRALAGVDPADESSQQDLETWAESHGLELITHCHYDCPMYVLAVTGTQVRAWRGSPQKITSLVGPMCGTWAILTRAGAPAPGWLLFSVWG